MRKSDALKVFGSNRAIAQALGISEAAVSQWGEKGREDKLVPPLSAFKLAQLSNGKLPFDPSLYRGARTRRIVELLSAAS